MNVSSTRAWVLLRILLGTLQMVGAVLSLALLVQTGVSAPALATVVATCTCTTISVLLFGRRSRLGAGGK